MPPNPRLIAPEPPSRQAPDPWGGVPRPRPPPRRSRLAALVLLGLGLVGFLGGLALTALVEGSTGSMPGAGDGLAGTLGVLTAGLGLALAAGGGVLLVMEGMGGGR